MQTDELHLDLGFSILGAMLLLFTCLGFLLALALSAVPSLLGGVGVMLGIALAIRECRRSLWPGVVAIRGGAGGWAIRLHGAGGWQPVSALRLKQQTPVYWVLVITRGAPNESSELVIWRDQLSATMRRRLCAWLALQAGG